MLSSRYHRLCSLLLAAMVALILGVQPAWAQTGPVEVRILAVDYGTFPDICLRVAPVAANGMMPGDLALDSFQIYESGVARPVTSVARQYIGTQIAIVFDTAGSFGGPGSRGSNRLFDDAIAALDELLLSKKWLQPSPPVDQFLLIVPTGLTTIKVAVPWTVQPALIHNGAYQSAIVSTDTPLYKMLIEAMVRMKDLPDYEQRAKFLLVFSDGIDRTSANDVTDVINRANNLGVKILTVQIGTGGNGKTLQRLAEETPRDFRSEWAYTLYTGNNSLAPLYSAIKSQAEQYLVCYRSRINRPGAHNIEVGVKAGGREYKSPARSISISPLPPSVKIVAPADGTVYDRIASSWDQDPSTIEPREEPVTVEVTWPDNFPRNIERVLYEVDGSTVANLSPNEVFVWDFSRLAQGIHSLRVVVRDELGIEGASDPARIEINMVIPPAPTPTLAPPPTPTPLPPWPERLRLNVEEQPMLLVVFVVAVLAALLALYALIRLLRNPQVRESFTTTVTQAVRDPTIIFKPKRGPSAAPRAFLVPIIDDIGTRGDPIAVRWQTTYIGRDPGRAQIVFADKTVSRLHARLVEETDHEFVLHDEGSTSGTYVNDTQISVAQPQKLKQGDVLEFGRVRVIFQLAGDSQTTQAGRAQDQTETLVRRR